MFITKLKNYKSGDLAIQFVTNTVKQQRQVIAQMDSPTKLLKVATNTHKVSTQHPLAKPLAKVAKEATERAIALQNKLDTIAKQVVVNGTEVNGGSGRFTQMVNRHGHANALVRTVECCVGAKNFYKLVEKNALQYTAEFFVAKYMPFAVSTNVLNEIHQLLSTIEQPTLLKEVA